MSVSGHRSESSLKSYCKTGQNTKEKMADSLMSVIASSSTSGSNTVTRPVENEVSSSLSFNWFARRVPSERFDSTNSQ